MFTAKQLISDIRQLCRLSEYDSDYSDAVLLRLADQELLVNILPWLVEQGSGYTVKPIDVAVTANKNRYQIHPRTLGVGLHDLNLIAADGSEVSLAKARIDNVSDIRAKGQPECFVLQGSTIVLYPIPDRAYTLRQYVNVKPGKLFTLENGDIYGTYGAKISSIAGNVVTLATTFPTTVPAYDVIASNSPSDAKLIESTGSGTGTTRTLSDTSELSAGDFLCVPGYTPFVQIPEELTPMLILAVSIRYFKALNYADQLANSVAELDKLKNDLAPLYNNRVPEAHQIVYSIL